VASISRAYDVEITESALHDIGSRPADATYFSRPSTTYWRYELGRGFLKVARVVAPDVLALCSKH